MTNQILVIDPIGGIAGDMFVGACCDLGLIDHEALWRALEPIVDVSRFDLRRERRAAIDGIRFDTALEGIDAHHHRSLAQVLSIVAQTGLSDEARARAVSMCSSLAAAESKAHGVPVANVAFHEVGAIDSIVDICAAAFCLTAINAGRVFCAEVPLGRGWLKFSHSEMPIPGPAVLNLLAGAPTVRGRNQGEMTTPTGAAILKQAVTDWSDFPSFIVGNVGYGHGARDTGDVPNTTRLIVGTLTDQVGQQIIEIVTLLDDMNPELVSILITDVIEFGALDAYTTAVIGKKGRHAIELTIIATIEASERVADWVLTNSSTTGIRRRRCDRRLLVRELGVVNNRGYAVRAKRIWNPKRTDSRVTIEADSLRNYSAERGVSLLDGQRELLAGIASKTITFKPDGDQD